MAVKFLALGCAGLVARHGECRPPVGPTQISILRRLSAPILWRRTHWVPMSTRAFWCDNEISPQFAGHLLQNAGLGPFSNDKAE